jgi:hypothetical protein
MSAYLSLGIIYIIRYINANCLERDDRKYYARPVDYSGEDRSCENFGNRWLIALLLSYYAGMLREENDHEPKLIIYTSPA